MSACFDPSREVHVVDGIAYVLPRYEGGVKWARRVGSFGIGVSWRWSSFNIGVDILQAGALIAIGPAYLWIAHIEKQAAAFAAHDASAIEARRAADSEAGAVHESAAPRSGETPNA